MDIPPPPQNYYAPPPPPKKDGCWKWGAIGCIGLGLLGVIGFAILVFTVSKSPAFKRIVNTATSMAVAEQDMKTVHSAILSYHKDKKSYPVKLKDLVPVYLTDESTLHLERDVAASLYTYHAPTEDSPDTFVILEAVFPPIMEGQNLPPTKVRVMKDGTIVKPDFKAQPGGVRIEVK